MMRTDGSLEPPGRSGMLTRVQRTPRQLPARQRSRLSSEGVALPSTSAAPAQPGKLGRGLAGMVARSLVLLVGALMLLVHDDKANVGERGEQRRARAHHHVDPPAAREVPLVEALAAGEARVQDGHVVTEAAAEAAPRSGP